MEWGALAIPVILSLLALAIYKHKIVWWEMVLPLAVSLIVVGTMKGFMANSNIQDIEYLSEYVVDARYYEDWNERVSCRHPRYCTRMVTYSCGTSKAPRTCTRMERYQCGWMHPYDVDYHSEYWAKTTNCKHSYNISQSEFNSLVALFGNKRFVDLKRNYHTNDGDMYKTDFTGKFEHVKALSWSQPYENKTQATQTVFQFRDLDSTETIGLYDYPPITKRKQDACLGCNKEDNLMLRRYNGLLGRKHQVKIFVLKFDGDISQAEKQLHYWKNGNKNEIVICKGPDWTRTFSWADNKAIEVNINHIFNAELPFETKMIRVQKEIENNWTRKEFKDFSYIKVPLTRIQMIWIYSITFFVSVCLLVFGIFNDIDNDRLSTRNRNTRYY